MAGRPRMPPPLLAISSTIEGGGAEWSRWARSLVDAGVEWLRIRNPGIDDVSQLALLRRLRAEVPGLRLSVSGRPDLAKLASIDVVPPVGVHLPSDGVPLSVAREVAGSEAWIGRSTHSVAEVEAAVQEGATYVVFGPVFAPLSKPRSYPAVGVDELNRATRLPVPVYALGGVTIDRLAELAAAGAAGAAGISAFREPNLSLELSREAAACFARP